MAVELPDDPALDRADRVQKLVHAPLIARAEPSARPLRILENRIEDALVPGDALLRRDGRGARRIRRPRDPDKLMKNLEGIDELVHGLRGAGPRNASAAGTGLTVAVAKGSGKADLQGCERRCACEGRVLGEYLVDRDAVGLVAPKGFPDRCRIHAGHPRTAESAMRRLDVRRAVGVEGRGVLEIRHDAELRLQRRAERLEYRRQRPRSAAPLTRGTPEVGSAVRQVDG